ncbi:restriction endonuclease subunit S [uncultured Ilyobacter sp.]|uniref:restriction endonuclease subunit S n=1 Tax=uncultured Ilyobacter sp. TaxID=544433 RepID=UPI0029C09CF1|nr:restriction endonuclease subunit S [uncultured Ilyobacter sp.]
MEKRRQPKLRFPEFLGKWEKKKLGTIAKKNNIKNKDESVTNVFTNSAIQGIVNQQDYFDRDIANQNNLGGYYVVQKDDFIYNPRISKAAPVGPIKRNHLGEGVMSPLYSIFRFQKSDLIFLEFYFESTFWHKYMKGIANYGARHDRMNITNEDFFKMPIPVPSLPEQQKIASFLSSVDSKIEKLEKKKTLLDDYKRGVMQKIFSQEIRFRGEDGKEYPEWVEKRLGDMAHEVMYGMNAAATEFDGKHKYLRITDIDENSNKFAPNPLVSPLGEIEDKFKLKNNDLLFTRTGASTGKSYLYSDNDEELYFAGFLIKFSINQEHNSKFIFYNTLLKKYKNWVYVMSMRSGQPGINAEEYKSFKIDLPCLQEQEKIANFLSGIDRKIELVERETERMKEFKKGLLQQMFV